MTEENINNYKYREITKNIDAIIDMCLDNFAIRDEDETGEFMFSTKEDIFYPMYRNYKDKNIIHLKFEKNIFGEQPRYEISVTTYNNSQTYTMRIYYHGIINKVYSYTQSIPVITTDVDINTLDFLIKSFVFLLNNTKLSKWNKMKLNKYISKIKKYQKEGD